MSLFENLLKFNYRTKELDKFFQFLCISLFFILSFSIAKNAWYFENKFNITSFSDVDTEIVPKRSIIIEFPGFWNSLFSRKTGLNF